MTTRETGDNTRKAGDTKMSQRHRFDAPVPTDAIMTRSQSGRELSYLDGHYIITQANNLLGHEEWSYTVDKYEVVQSEYKKSGNGKELHYVGYIAQVTVTWKGVTRSDVGFGQGQDADLGRSHESAIKEAATDALKRALRTFGQALGLALYDKSGAHIAEVVEFNLTQYVESLAFSDADFKAVKTMFPVKEQRNALLRDAWDNNVTTSREFFDFVDTKAPVNGLPMEEVSA